MAFSLFENRYKVEEIVDRWFGEGSSYFKVRAEDQNIYLLKYDQGQDVWDLVFFQNPRVATVMNTPNLEANPPSSFSSSRNESDLPPVLN